MRNSNTIIKCFVKPFKPFLLKKMGRYLKRSFCCTSVASRNSNGSSLNVGREQLSKMCVIYFFDRQANLNPAHKAPVLDQI